MARSSSGLGHRPLKAEITGSNPVRATNIPAGQSTNSLACFRFAGARKHPCGHNADTMVHMTCAETPLTYRVIGHSQRFVMYVFQ